MVSIKTPDKSPEAMRALARKRWDQYVQDAVDSAPPLTEEQIKAIAAVLRQVGRGRGDAR